jgi:hypothetical protein
MEVAAGEPARQTGRYDEQAGELDDNVGARTRTAPAAQQKRQKDKGTQ